MAGHTHDHGHEHHDHAVHAHDHSHAHGGHDATEYYTEQLLTIFTCGALGLTSVLMVAYGRLEVMLVPEFHNWLLIGGIALLALTAFRAAALWVSVGPAGEVAPGHVHGPDCDHGHGGTGDHSGHDHLPGAIYLKVIPLALPLLLFMMGLPNKSFSQEWVNSRLGLVQDIGEVKPVEERGGDQVSLDFNELNMAAYDAGKRATYEGRRVTVSGQVRRVSEKEYELYELKMTCCAADMIPLKARIRSESVIPTSQFKEGDRVRVEGVLQFVELPGKKQFLPVIRIGGKGGPGMVKV